MRLPYTMVMAWCVGTDVWRQLAGISAVQTRQMWEGIVCKLMFPAQRSNVQRRPLGQAVANTKVLFQAICVQQGGSLARIEKHTERQSKDGGETEGEIDKIHRGFGT